ncbi:hypothetical protein EMIT0196MI5_80127 [Pseudomonas sp. IT-196MI5]
MFMGAHVRRRVVPDVLARTFGHCNDLDWFCGIAAILLGFLSSLAPNVLFANLVNL